MSAEPVTIASWRKNSRETLMVRLAQFKGQAVVDHGSEVRLTIRFALTVGF